MSEKCHKQTHVPQQANARVSYSITSLAPDRKSGEIAEDKWVKDATAKGVDGAAVVAAFREEVKRVAAGN